LSFALSGVGSFAGEKLSAEDLVSGWVLPFGCLFRSWLGFFDLLKS
jgi:hypothetical protein